jgi:hypothetical protein
VLLTRIVRQDVSDRHQNRGLIKSVTYSNDTTERE